MGPATNRPRGEGSLREPGHFQAPARQLTSSAGLDAGSGPFERASLFARPRAAGLSPMTADSELSNTPCAAPDPQSKPGAPTQHYWLWVLCLLGVDYFSSLAYQPSITFEVAGYLGPIATVGVV